MTSTMRCPLYSLRRFTTHRGSTFEGIIIETPDGDDGQDAHYIVQVDRHTRAMVYAADVATVVDPAAEDR